jgi:hypothetical protein
VIIMNNIPGVVGVVKMTLQNTLPQVPVTDIFYMDVVMNVTGVVRKFVMIYLFIFQKCQKNQKLSKWIVFMNGNVTITNLFLGVDGIVMSELLKN